jgi:DNA-binding GntR family transcriptional regulator
MAEALGRGASATITTRIRAALTEGRFAPNQQLFEANLAAHFHTSRGPIREALHQLTAEGLLRQVPNRGVFVIPFDVEALLDLYFARRVVEETAAVALSKSRNPRLSGLEVAMARLRRATKGRDWARIVQADLDFHEALVEASESRHLIRMFRALSGEARMSLLWFEQLYPEPGDLIDEHQPILDAIASHDSTSVKKQLAIHMREAMQRLSEEARRNRDSIPMPSRNASMSGPRSVGAAANLRSSPKRTKTPG